jgi:ankyrin repeat protein
MHDIAAHWDKTVADYLFKRGLDIHLKDNSGRTPLHVAASTNNVEIVEWLADQGVDLAAKTNTENHTPLHYAARYDAVDALLVLVEKGGKL